jgi:IclR family transcriptional regulator, acetate operon repressor
MKQSSKTPYPGTRAITRAVALLKAFSDLHPRWRVTDLARELKLPKPTVVRLLAALERDAMVMREPVTGMYGLGPGAIALGSLALRSNDLRTVARVELEMLAAETSESTTLEILVGTEVLILDEVRVLRILGTAPDVGTRWPAHATSTGKVMLAESTLQLSARLQKFTRHTITSGAALRRELETVRERGYATAVEELVEGFAAVAAAIRNHEGQCIAALSVGGPTVRMTRARLPQLGRLVRDAAERITTRLGG